MSAEPQRGLIGKFRTGRGIINFIIKNTRIPGGELELSIKSEGQKEIVLSEETTHYIPPYPTQSLKSLLESN